MKLNKKTCDLKSCFFCQNSLKEWLPAIQAHRKSYKVPKGGLLFEEGTPVKGIFFINEGKVKVHKKWGNDKETVFRIMNEFSQEVLIETSGKNIAIIDQQKLMAYIQENNKSSNDIRS